MSLLQLEDPLVGETINATLGSLRIPFIDVTQSPATLSINNGIIAIDSSEPSVPYRGDLIISTPENSGIIQVNDFQHSVGIGAYPLATNQLFVNKDADISGSLTISGPTAPFSRAIADPVRGSIRTSDFQVGSNGEGFGAPWQDCRYIYNPSAESSNGIVSVWSIINDVSGGNVGDVYFRQNVFVDKNVSITGQLTAPNFSFSNALPKGNFVMSVPGGTIQTGTLTTLPKPASLPVGTYCIMLQVNGRQAFNISTFARWNGISWSAGGSSMTEDVANGGAKAILNSNGIALQFYHEAGAPITLDYVYYYGLGTN